MNARAVPGRLRDEAGVTLTEMLVVLLILGIVLAGMTTLFVSAGTSQVEQTNRVEAQRNARLALDGLRRELRCASAATPNTTPPAVPVSVPPRYASVTVTLPGYCQKPPTTTAAPFTWCASGGSAPYALWRYAGSSCSGTGTKKAEALASNSIFSYNRSTPGPVQLAPLPGASVTDGYFKPGTYAYLVSAVTSSGEISGSTAKVTITTGSPNQITVTWNAPSYPVLSYNVYGRDDGTTTVEGMRKLANVSAGSTSYVDLGCATPADGCSPVVAVSSQSAAPPLATVSFALTFDVTTADGRQRFTLEDDVVLRNSGRY